jgi:isoquinoline 1-oxidoreductase subunit beta
MHITRRQFVKVGAGLTFTLSMSLASSISREESKPATGMATAWVNIDTDNTITIFCPVCEMGQGSMTALPLILAEELDADWDNVNIEFSPIDTEVYANPVSWAHGLMLTAGSTAVRAYYNKLRVFGAQIRQVLLISTAKKLNISIDELSTNKSLVIHNNSGKQLSYGEIAGFTETPKTLPSISEQQLKEQSKFRLIGHDVPRYDIPEKVNGTAVYSIDIQLPDMLYATVQRAPVRGATLAKMDHRAALLVPGIVKIFSLEYGVAVVGRTYAAVLAAVRVLSIEWDMKNSDSEFNSNVALNEHIETARDLKHSGFMLQENGDLNKALAVASKTYQAEYQTDFVYHAQLEPVNSVSWVKNGGNNIEIWAGTQSPTHLVRTVATTLGIPITNVMLHQTYLGGSFGRRLEMEHEWVVDSVLLSREFDCPVKSIWRRETDLQCGRFKPISAHYLRAAEDESSDITCWQHRIVSDEPLAHSDPYRYKKGEFWPGNSGPGAGTIYDFPNIQAEVIKQEVSARLSPLRGVGVTPNKFASESFIDDIARLKGLDPLEFRMKLLHKNPLAQHVLRTVAEMADWGKKSGVGVSFIESSGTLLGTIAEVSVDQKTGLVSVLNVWATIDAGIAIQPNNIIGQLQGAIVYGIGNALKERITFHNGAVEQSNFHDYQVMRMSETPDIECHIVDSSRSPSGCAEIGSMGIVPAVANAIAAIIGRSVRHMPMTPERVLKAIRA